MGATRTPDKTDALRRAGAEPVVVNALDCAAVMKAVTAARPDVVVHQLTALANIRNLKNLDREFVLTNRLRTEGTEYLLAAAQAAGAQRFVAQSYTGWPNGHTGGRIKTENDPLDPNPPRSAIKSLEAIHRLETMASKASGLVGIALRYGSFYGPGTSLATDGDVVQMIRSRKFPLVGSGAGIWSFIHIDDAAAATRIAIEGGPSGIYNIVDDEPVEVSIWLPELAQAIGAPPPRRVPAWLARFAAGEMIVSMMTEVRGSSNAKAKEILGWKPVYPIWRDGFRRGLDSGII